MDEHEMLALQFEKNRTRLKAVAYRMLGSASEADDAVQESWLRLSRSDAEEIRNLEGWLTTVVARVCLDILRSRKTRREVPLNPAVLEGGPRAEESNPEQEAVLADSIGSALLVVLDTLAPAERIAFVLHDMFDVPFDEIAQVVGRTPEAARQLASRGRRRVQGASGPARVSTTRHRKVVDAFLAAARNGDFEALLAVLDPEVEMRADEQAARLGAPKETRGGRAVGAFFHGRSAGAVPVLVDGSAGAMWAPGGNPRVVFIMGFKKNRITRIDLVADPERILGLQLVVDH